MVRDQESEKHPAGLQQLGRLLNLNIRNKIVLPYLILTLSVAIVGTYVVTRLVASSLDERLTNQLLEAGRVVSDSLARREMDHLESARAIAFTVGLAEALQAGDRDSVVALAQPAAVVRGVESLIVVDADGREVLHTLQHDDGSSEFVEGQFDTSGLWMVRVLLEAGDPNGLPRRGLVNHPVDQRYYYFTAIPIGLENRMVGAVVVGTSLDTLLPHFKITSLADVIIYLDGGRAVASTFTGAEQGPDKIALLDELSTTPALYESALQSTGSTTGENVRIRGRSYRVGRASLRVGNDVLGVFAVALPSHFIVQAGATSRNTYALIFSTAMAAVILVGYLVSQLITRPLSRLVRTSQAVADGDLEQRTGIVSADEIGMLAETFDEMTGRLSERTRALEEAIGRMRAILSSIGDGVVLEDLGGKLNPLNAAAETLLEEMADNFALGPLRELSVEGYEQISDLQPSPWLLERRRFQVGKKVISAHSAAVRTEKGEHLGTVIVLRDVTAEAEAERLKDAFITHVSHELRTPLTAIKGYSELLVVAARDALNEEQLGFLETISRHTDNLVAMINELLDFSEMEAGGRLGLRQRPVLLTTLVEEIAQELRPQIREKGLTLQVKTPADLPLVDADTRRLRWAIINIVRNAWQYTPAGGSVTLRLSAHDGEVVLDVIDTGIGISPENQQRLFSRFYRVTNVTQDDVRGLGLGLYVTRAIVEAHGGNIQVFSKEGVGSTFSVILPALQDHWGEKGAD
ncbi:MAG TPA: ATP-binding protein [Anaerolineae bacterium]|nr:ATP-binding protein [Anaerolineae bacterium]